MHPRLPFADTHGLGRRWTIRSGTTAALAGALLLSACDQPFGAANVPEHVVEPATIGVVASLARRDDGALATMADGSEVLIPNGARELTGPAEESALLIVGTGGPAESDDGVWYASLRSGPSGCYWIAANGEVRGQRLALSAGFSLPLSDQWDEAETVFINSPTVEFCVDASGAVVRPRAHAP